MESTRAGGGCLTQLQRQDQDSAGSPSQLRWLGVSGGITIREEHILFLRSQWVIPDGKQLQGMIDVFEAEENPAGRSLATEVSLTDLLIISGHVVSLGREVLNSVQN